MGSGVRALSQDHSIWLLGVESAVGLDIELGLQKLVMKSSALLWFFNKYAPAVDVCLSLMY